MSWTLPGAILFLLGLVLLLGYFLSRKVFPSEGKGSQEATPSQRAPCEGCDVPGCGGFAKSLIRGGPDSAEDAEHACEEGSCGCGPVEAPVQTSEYKAVIRCKGTHVLIRYHYAGARSCQAAAQMAVRPKECGNACLGFGDCCHACLHRAIHVEGGLARVDPARCNGCGDCLKSCPLDLVSLIPALGGLAVACKGPEGLSKDWACPDGCTACGECIDSCPESALKPTEEGPPRWIEECCTGCGRCVDACPQGVVLLFESRGLHEESDSVSSPLPPRRPALPGP